MKCGKLTAKLRDAVPVCFIEEGKEIKRVKNIEIPGAIKELEYKGFKFDVPMSGAITFKIYFEPGTLPETWPEPRQRKTRAKKDEIAAPAGEDAAQDAPEMAQEAADPQPEEFPQDEAEAVAEPAEAASEDDPGKEDEPIPEAMEIHYDVPGSARKALASAIGEIIGTYPSYQAAPSFAYIIGEYTLDRNGVLTGPRNSQLMLTLDQDGYRAK
jgi:hypothetical protein